MKVSNISSYNSNNKTYNIFKSHPRIVSHTKSISSDVFQNSAIAFGAVDAIPSTVTQTMQMKDFPQKYKPVLNELAEIDGFVDLAQDMTPKQIAELAAKAYKYYPIITDMLNGDIFYTEQGVAQVLPYNSVKDIIRHNEEHPDDKANILDEVNEVEEMIDIMHQFLTNCGDIDNTEDELFTAIAGNGAVAMSINKKLSREEKIEKVKDLVEQLNQEFIILYDGRLVGETRDKVIDLNIPKTKLDKQLVAKKFVDTPKGLNEFLASDATNKEKHIMYMYSELPYFNSAVKSLDKDEISEIAKMSVENPKIIPCFITDNILSVFAPNIVRMNPVDLRQITKHNMRHPSEPIKLNEFLKTNPVIKFSVDYLKYAKEGLEFAMKRDGAMSEAEINKVMSAMDILSIECLKSDKEGRFNVKVMTQGTSAPPVLFKNERDRIPAELIEKFDKTKNTSLGVLFGDDNQIQDLMHAKL